VLLRFTLRSFEDELHRCGLIDLWLGRFNTNIGHRDQLLALLSHGVKIGSDIVE
jgi:hypothetical protein